MKTGIARKITQENKAKLKKQARYIYIVHSVIPSYFSQVGEALKHAWATNTRAAHFAATMALPTAEKEVIERRAWQMSLVYLTVAARALRKNGVFTPDWQSDFPQVKITREQLQ
jgi:hypothetical protein